MAIIQIKPDIHIKTKHDFKITSIVTSSIQSPPDSKDFKFKSTVSNFEKLLAEKFHNLSLFTLTDNKQVSSNEEINKLKWADKLTQYKYYYNKPTPMDVIFEEQEYLISNSYNGKSVYEWNIDGFTDTHIYNIARRMLIYSTACKIAENTAKNISNMIIAGFTGQLRLVG